MLRGELSNQPAAICAIDYRILLDTKKPMVWFAKTIPNLINSTRFENAMKKALPLKQGAALWLDRNWERRFAVISVGVSSLGRAIDMVLGDYLAEGYHFEDRNEFRRWILETKQLYKVYTNDPLLLGMDEIIQRHTGWYEKA
jgi:hypothetical protein